VYNKDGRGRRIMSVTFFSLGFWLGFPFEF
jgi:hypothetical protein